MNDDLDLLVRKAEQEVRLDQLEPLVRERRGVDRDLRAHLPGRVRERVGAASRLRARSRVRPRNGPPEAVSTIESTVSGARPSRHWKSAECSLSTGRACLHPAPGRQARALPPRRGSPCSRGRASRPARAPRASRAARRSRRRRSARRPARRGRAARSRSPPTWSVLDAALGGERSRARSTQTRARRPRAPDCVDDLERLAPDRAGGAENRNPLHARKCRRPHSWPKAAIT